MRALPQKNRISLRAPLRRLLLLQCRSLRTNRATFLLRREEKRGTGWAQLTRSHPGAGITAFHFENSFPSANPYAVVFSSFRHSYSGTLRHKRSNGYVSKLLLDNRYLKGSIEPEYGGLPTSQPVAGLIIGASQAGISSFSSVSIQTRTTSEMATMMRRFAP